MASRKLHRHVFPRFANHSPRICFPVRPPAAAAAAASAIVDAHGHAARLAVSPAVTRRGCPRLYLYRRTLAAALPFLNVIESTAVSASQLYQNTPAPVVTIGESSDDGGTFPAAPAAGYSCFPPDSQGSSRSRLVISSSSSRARPCSDIIAHEAVSDPPFLSFLWSVRRPRAICPDCSNSLWINGRVETRKE